MVMDRGRRARRQDETHQRQVTLAGAIEEIVSDPLAHSTRWIGLREFRRKPALVAEHLFESRTKQLYCARSVRFPDHDSLDAGNEGVKDGRVNVIHGLFVLHV